MKKTNVLNILTLSLTLSLAFTSCEKPVIDEEPTEPKSDGFQITFNVNKFDITDFNDQLSGSRSTVDISTVSKRINFAVFNGDTRITEINQTSSDADFGKIKVSLSAGTYKIIALAHNGEGNATITDPAKIVFKDNKITDTFFYVGDITVTGEGSHDLTMTRVVARFRLIIKDEIPASVAQFKFYYTGGSSTFSAIDKAGIVNSRQTETLTASKDSIYDVYTFPRTDSQALKMTVTALTSAGVTVAEKTFENVPITVNKSTIYRGYFFGNGSDSKDEGFTFKVDNSWTEESHNY